jgi:hypothetical protein
MRVEDLADPLLAESDGPAGCFVGRAVDDAQAKDLDVALARHDVMVGEPLHHQRHGHQLHRPEHPQAARDRGWSRRRAVVHQR